MNTWSNKSKKNIYMYSKKKEVYLYCGKFRIMTSWNAFISEYSPNLIYFFKPPNLSSTATGFIKDIN